MTVTEVTVTAELHIPPGWTKPGLRFTVQAVRTDDLSIALPPYCFWMQPEEVPERVRAAIIEVVAFAQGRMEGELEMMWPEKG